MKKKILSLILALSTSASISLPVLANEQKTETLLQNKVEEYLIAYDDITLKNDTKIIENEKNLMNESLNKPDNDLESEINLDKNSKAYSFNRNAMYNYAKKHYNNPNPNYYDYTSLGGDCTNFVSQIIKAGGAPYDLSGSQSQQWYYKSSNNKSPSWTGVENLDDYLLYNKSTGPQAQNGSVYNAAVGDVVQIDSNSDGKYTHSVSIVYHTNGNMNSTTVAARTSNAFNRALTSYPGAKRWLHLTGYSN